MSLSRKALRELALTEEQAEAVISMHAATVEALKEQIESQRQEAQAAREESKAARLELTEYRDSVARAEELRRREQIYRNLLRESGVAEKRHDAILRVTDLENLSLEGAEVPETREALIRQVREEWSDFIPQTHAVGALTPHPPEPEPMTRAAILAIADRKERRAAMAEHLNLF